jgi:hypothetical protein
VRNGAWIALALLAGGVTACSGINSQTHSYATLEEARQAGAIERGWLPDGLPPGAYEIRVAYVPGGPERWGLFNFPPGEGDMLRAWLSPEEIPLGDERVDVPSRIEWWPVALRRTLDAEQLALTGLKGYRTRDGRLVVAVNWPQGRAYYWNRE